MRSIIRVVIRIILIFLFLRMVFLLISYSGAILTFHDIYPDVLTLFGAAVIGTFILWLLWWKTDWLVRILAGNISEDSLVISTSNLDLFKTVIRILGIYLIVTTIPELIGHIGYRLSIPTDYYIPGQIQATWIKGLLIIIFTLIIGLLLTFLSGKTVSFIRNLWNTAGITDTRKKQ